MTTFFIRALIFSICLFSFSLKAQNIPSIRWEPKISCTRKIDDRWSFNLSVTARQKFNNYRESTSSFHTDRWDIRGFGTYTMFGSKRLSLGYIFRTINPFEGTTSYEHRISQQFNFITRLANHRIGNEIVIEERIFTMADYITRLRYTISHDFPLQGEKLDVNEFYLIAENELLYSFNRVENSLENRFSVGIGRILNNGKKIQLSIQSRYLDLISSNNNHILQFNTAYYFRK